MKTLILIGTCLLLYLHEAVAQGRYSPGLANDRMANETHQLNTKIAQLMQKLSRGQRQKWAAVLGKGNGGIHFANQSVNGPFRPLGIGGLSFGLHPRPVMDLQRARNAIKDIHAVLSTEAAQDRLQLARSSGKRDILALTPVVNYITQFIMDFYGFTKGYQEAILAVGAIGAKTDDEEIKQGIDKIQLLIGATPTSTP